MAKKLNPRDITTHMKHATNTAVREAKRARARVLVEVGDKSPDAYLESPLGMKALMFAANEHYQAKRYEEARRLYERAAAKGVDAARHRLGQIHEQLGEYESALEIFTQLINEDPSNGEAAYRAAVCAGALKENARNEIMLIKAIRSGREDKRYAEALWNRLPSNTPHWRRVEIAELILENDTSNRATWLKRLADYRWMMNDHSGGAEALLQLEQLRSLSATDLYRVGMNAFESGERATAADRFSAAVAAAGDDAKRVGPALFAEKEKDWSAALELIDAFPGASSPAERLYEKAFCHEKLVNYADASNMYAAAIVLDGDRPYWHYKFGLALERLGEYEQAITAYEVANSLGKPVGHWRFRAGRCMQQLGRHREAFEAYALAFGIDTSALSEDTSNADISLEAALIAGEEVASVGLPAEQQADAVDEGRRRSYLEFLRANCTEGFSQHRFTLEGWVDRSLATMRIEEKVDPERLTLLSQLSLKGDAKTRGQIALLAAQHDQWELAAETLRHIEAFGDKDGLNPNSYLKSANARRDVHYAEALAELPLIPKVVLWESNHGSSFGCHPLAMLRSMLADPRYADYTHVIGLNDPNAAPKDVFEHPNVSFVRLHSRSYMQVLATAEFLVSNVSFAPYFVRREGQKYLNTWHGTPMKTLGRSMRGKLLEFENLQRNFQVSTMLMAPNDLTEWAMIEDHDIADSYRGKSVVAGSPRLDTSINMTPQQRQDLRRELGIYPDDDRTVVLFAPTWRGGVSERELDADALIQDLTAMASAPDTILLYRAHRLTEKLLEGVELPVTVVPAHIDTNELLAAIDVLVTDYSSILFDFIPQNKPIVLYVHDLEEYKADRGLYLEPEQVPGLVSRDREELLEAISRATRGEGVPTAADAEKFTPYEDGHAAERMVRAFFDGDTEGCRVRDYAVEHGAVGKTSLLFHASLIPNGIASAFLALLHAIDYDKYSVSVIVEPQMLRNNEDRAEIYDLLPPQVHRLCRVGGFVDTIREKALISAYAARPTFTSDVFWDRYWARYDKERRRLFGDFVPDVAVEYDGYAELWASLIAVFGRHGSETSCYQHNQMRNEYELKLPNLLRTFALYKDFDHIIAVSERLSDVNERGLTELGYPTEGRQEFARNLLNVQKVRELAEEELDDDIKSFIDRFDTTFVTIGRMSQEKNQLALLDGLRKAIDKGNDLGLVLVGSGLLQGYIETRILELGLEDRVLLTGQLPNPISVLVAGDCFILPSTHEGQPVTLLEAMCMSKDIISSDAPGSKELIDLGYGLLCGTSADAIAEAMAAYVETPSLARGDFDSDAFSAAALEKTLAVIDSRHA